MNRPADFPAPPPDAGRDVTTLIRALHALRAAPRDGAGYWHAYCALVRELCRASAVLLVSRADAGTAWEIQGQDVPGDDWVSRHWAGVVAQRTAQPMDKGFACAPVQDETGRLRILALVKITGIGDALLVVDIPDTERAQLNELIMRAMLVADFPVAGNAAQATGTALVLDDGAARHAASVDATFDLLDLSSQVMAQTQFDAATLVLVNGLAAHFKADQVALGWRAGAGIRTVAISHIDRFERNTEIVQQMDEAFLEALGSKHALWYDGSDARLAAQGRLARTLDMQGLFAVPLADALGATGAVLLFAFKATRSQPPGATELHMTMGFLQPWLEQLRQRDRWWGARLRDWLAVRLARWLGPGRVWSRTAAIAASLLVLFAVFGTWDYRLEASAQMTTDSTRLISAQFDGRVDSVQASAGDVVKAGAKLARLDTRELHQQELDLAAERQRLAAETDKARAAGNLADLGIAEARAAQADARLARIGQYLGQAQAVAPFDGVVVAGERRDLLNAPVKKGDNLFRIARIDGLYVEIMVPERDVRFVRSGSVGELRLLSRPEEKILFTLSTVIPMAQVKGQEGNQFMVRGKLQGTPEDWWRPGMSGIALIDGGRQNVTWIATHRLVDTLRMKLWWLG